MGTIQLAIPTGMQAVAAYVPKSIDAVVVTEQVTLRGDATRISILFNKNGLPYATLTIKDASGQEHRGAINLSKSLHNRFMEAMFPAEEIEQYLKLNPETGVAEDTGRIRLKTPSSKVYGIGRSKCEVYMSTANGQTWYTLGKVGEPGNNSDTFAATY